MKYKVGDRVKIKSLNWYNENKNKRGNISFPYEVEVVFTPEMSSFCGQIVTISKIGYTQGIGFYCIRKNNRVHKWTDEMFEGLAEEEEIEFTEEDKYWCDIMSESDPTTYVLPQGYQFKDENGNIINATKIVLEKKKKEYPKTYEECCKVMGIPIHGGIALVGNWCMEDGYIVQHLETLRALSKLLIARDAYWKIAGEEMGLGKPWKPTNETVYCISRSDNVIKCSYRGGKSNILEFPTAEMRDAFKENFDPDIEFCKELL